MRGRCLRFQYAVIITLAAVVWFGIVMLQTLLRQSLIQEDMFAGRAEMDIYMMTCLANAAWKRNISKQLHTTLLATAWPAWGILNGWYICISAGYPYPESRYIHRIWIWYFISISYIFSQKADIYNNWYQVQYPSISRISWLLVGYDTMSWNISWYKVCYIWYSMW